jgi:protein-disulfide isomerase
MVSSLLSSLRIAGIAAAAGLGLMACSESSTTGASGGKDVPISPYLQDIVWGDPNAKVEVVEYASLSCTHCRDFWKQDLPRIKAEFIDTGKVRYILRDFPTPPVELSVAATAIARCAGKDGYYNVVDDVYTHYADLMDAVQSGTGAAPMLVEIGGRAGLSPDEVRTCVNSKDIQTYIQKVVDDARGKVTATPTVFVDGEKVENHLYPGLSAVINAKLNGAPVPADAAPATTPPAP